MPLITDGSISEFLSISETKGWIFSIANLATRKEIQEKVFADKVWENNSSN